MSSVAVMTMPVETAARDLKQLLEQLHIGETITLVNSDGTPLAVMVSLKPAPVEVEPVSDWEARWDALTRKVSQAWKSDQSAVEILTEMRRQVDMISELLPQVQALPKADKLRLMQFLVFDLAQEQGITLPQPGADYPIWTPYDAYDAASTLLSTLETAGI